MRSTSFPNLTHSVGSNVSDGVGTAGVPNSGNDSIDASYESGTPVGGDGDNHELTAERALSGRTDLTDDDTEVDYTITERDAEFDTTDGPVTVEAAPAESLAGTTTVAPGSEREMRLDSGTQR